MNYEQTYDTMIERSDLEAYLVNCGYWGNDELRRRHAYVLSPAVFHLTHLQERDLDRLAKCTYAAVKKLNNRLITVAQPGHHQTHEEGGFVKLGNNASRSLLQPRDKEERIPPVIKVDLIQNAKGQFFIAEVDVYNPRGFGYAALLEESLHPGFGPFRYHGIVGLLDLFTQNEAGEDIEWHILVSEFERYYETSFRILARSFLKYDKRIRILREEDIAEKRACLSGTPAGLLAIPESLNTHPKVREEMLSLYREQKLRTLYPPVAYLGSKAFLPFLRTCEGMAEFLPPTVLVGKKRENVLPNPEIPWVLKAAVSSGMKGVFFSDLDSEFAFTLDKARSQKNTSWILQEQVPQAPLPITVFNDDGSKVVKDYFLRITAYVSEDGIIDAEVTGRQDRKVHGAPDCIQLPVVLNRDFP
jgi:hypothetical protein